MPSNDPKYQKEYFAVWYKKNRNKQILACTKNRIESVKKNHSFIIEYLRNHPCVDCGETDILVLQFDHVRGKKRNHISEMLDFSLKSLKEEIIKCDVRCANCHVRKTAIAQNNFKVQFICSSKAEHSAVNRRVEGSKPSR